MVTKMINQTNNEQTNTLIVLPTKRLVLDSFLSLYSKSAGHLIIICWYLVVIIFSGYQKETYAVSSFRLVFYKDTKQIDVLTGELWSVDRLVANADTCRNALKSDLQASTLAT